MAADREFYLGSDSRSYAPFCEAIGRADLAEDPRFTDNVKRLQNREALQAELIPLFKTQPAAHWVDVCLKQGVPTSTVVSAHRRCENGRYTY